MLARWYRTRQRDAVKAKECLMEGERMLNELWEAEPKERGPIPFMGGRGIQRSPRFIADTEIWR